MKKLILIILFLGTVMTSCTPKYESVIPITNSISLEADVKIDSIEEFYVATEGKYCETIYVINKATDVVVYKASNIPLEEQKHVGDFNNIILGFLIGCLIVFSIFGIVSLFDN